MTILTTQIETAMDELISNEEGIQKGIPGEHLATSGVAEEEIDNLSALLAAGMNYRCRLRNKLFAVFSA